MKKLFAILLGLIGCSAHATDVVVNLSNMVGFYGSTTTNRECLVQSLSSPGVLGNSISLGQKTAYWTDINSSFTISNAPLGVTGVTVLPPPGRGYFEFNVTSTNLGVIQASTILSVSGAPTYPPGAVAWAASTADQRYSLSTNVLGSAAFLPLSYWQIASANLTNWSSVLTNSVVYTSQIGTAASANSSAFQPANNNLTNWSGVATSAVVYAAQIGTAASSNASAFQPANNNLTNWSGVSTNAVVYASQIGTAAGSNASAFYLASNPSAFVTSAVTNSSTATNDPRAVTLLNAANRFTGAFTGDGSGLSNLPLSAVSGLGLQAGSQNLTNWSGVATSAVVFASQVGTAAGSNASAFQPANNNLSGWSSVATSAVVYASQIGTAASSNASAFYLASNPFNFVTASVTNASAATNDARAVTLTNAANQFAGAFSGNGAGLTNLNLSAIGGSNLQNGSLNLSNWSGVATSAVVFVSQIGTAASSNASAFQPANNNLTNWSGVATSTVVFASQIGTAAGSNTSAFYLSSNPSNFVTTAVTNSSAATNDPRAVTFTNTANAFAGNGAGLSNLNAAKLTNTVTNVISSPSVTAAGLVRGLDFATTGNLFDLSDNGFLFPNGSLDANGNLAVNSLIVNGGGPFLVDFSGNVSGRSFAGNAIGLTNVPASQLSGTIADANQSANVMLRNASGTVSGSNTFSAAQGLTNVNNTLAGNGAGITNVASSNLTGTIQPAQIPANLVTSNYASVVSLTNAANNFVGGFTGNGAALTNIPSGAVNGLSTNYVVNLAGKATNLTTAGTNTYAGVSIFPEWSNTGLVNGNNGGVSLGTNVFVRLTGPTAAFTTAGFAGGVAGRWAVVFNPTAFAWTIANNSGGDIAGNRIWTGTGADVVITNAFASATFWYDGVSAYWILAAVNGSTNFNGSFTGNGFGLTNLNFVASNNVTLTTNAGAVYISATAGAATNAWNIGGNAGVTNGAFLGTTDGKPLIFEVNGYVGARFDVLSGLAPNFTVGGNGGTSSAQNSISGGANVGSSILGGVQNSIAGGGGESVIAGGYSNSILTSVGAIGGGNFNSIVGNWGTIGGGNNNSIVGADGTIPGGGGNTAGLYAFAAGQNASATNNNTFVWSDGIPFGSTSNGQFLIRSTNGVGINTNNPGTNTLAVNGSVLVTSNIVAQGSIGFIGNGGSLSNLNSANLNGTVATNRLPGGLPLLSLNNGTNLSNLNATNLYGFVASANGGLGFANTNLVPPGAVYDNGANIYSYPLYTLSVVAGTQYYAKNAIGLDSNQVIVNAVDPSGFEPQLDHDEIFTAITNKLYFFTAGNPGDPVTVQVWPVTTNLYGIFTGDGSGLSGVKVNASNVTGAFTGVTNNPVGYIVGSGTLSGTAGSHTITFGTAQSNLRRGWDIATRSDNAQYIILDIVDSTHVVVEQVPFGGGLANTYSATTNYWLYLNANDNNDIDGHPAGGVRNDGGVFTIGNQGLLANSGGFIWLNGSNTFHSYVGNDGAGHAFWTLGSVTNNSQVHIFTGAPNSSFEILPNGVASIPAGVSISTGKGVTAPLYTPASSAETNFVGSIRWDANYIYIWTATNVNKRAALTTW